MSSYEQFNNWYTNHINCGGNIGIIDASTVLPIEKQVINHFTDIVIYIRKNWKTIEDNHDYYINDFKKFMHTFTGSQCRYLIQFLWMADQEIHYKPVSYARYGSNDINIHPGKSRLYARWAQNKSTDMVFIDYAMPKTDIKYKPFNNVDEAWNGLTYTSHTPDIINTCSFKDTVSLNDLIDVTYQSDMHYYRTTNFEQILFIEDIKDDCYKEWQKSSKKYLTECLNNPIRYGSRLLNI